MAAIPDDVIVCSVCDEMFTDPRTLPCLHTYCLACISAWIDANRDPTVLDATSTCPICRQPFDVPTDVDKLPKNFLVGKLLQATKDPASAAAAAARPVSSSDDKLPSSSVLLEAACCGKQDDRNLEPFCADCGMPMRVCRCSTMSCDCHQDAVVDRTGVPTAVFRLHRATCSAVDDEARYTVDADRRPSRIVGGRTVKDDRLLEPTLSHTQPVRGRVGGMTSLGDELYVVCYNSPVVDVFDAMSSKTMHSRPKRQLPVPGLGSWPLGIAAVFSCYPAPRRHHNGHVYVSDFNNNSIHRVGTVCDYRSRSWPVGRGPVGVSITTPRSSSCEDYCVLVTCSVDGIIQEYTHSGALFRQISGYDGLRGPWQAVETADGRGYVVSVQRGDFTTRNSVCLVVGKDTDEQVYNWSTRNTLRMGIPFGLAVAPNGWILVADRDNDMIVIVDPTLRTSRRVITTAKPRAIALDTESGQLYVAADDSNAIDVYEYAFDV